MFDSYVSVFTDRARSYQAAMEFAPDARRAEFLAMVEPLDRGENGRLCDMPAGGSYLLRYLAPSCEYIGVEPVQDFVAAGAKTGGMICQAPLTDVPLPDASVDYVVSLAGLHHEDDLAPVFREMRRLLRDGGRAVIGDVAAGTRPACFLNGFVARNNPLGHNGRFLDDRTAELLGRAGLAVREDQLMSLPWRFPDRIAAARFCADLFGLDGLEPQQMASALDAELGFEADGSAVRLNWALRRFICEAA